MDQKNVLIVDDETEICEVIQDFLEDDFEKVMIAHNVQEAINHLTKNIFHCIVLDINLGDNNGGEVLQYLSKNSENKNNSAPVILCSGYIDGQSN